MFVDTHCHIDTILEKDKIPLSELFSRMKECLPEALVHVACEPQDWAWGRDFLSSKELPFKVYGAFGAHPQAAQFFDKSKESELRESLGLPNAVALGEIGLDYYNAEADPKTQKEAFERQIEIAFELQKPVVLHIRNAEHDALEILKSIDKPTIKAHLHCFAGNVDFAEKILSLSGEYYFGFTGIITFKNGENVREAAKIVPQNRLLLETDAPYLAPVPWRGKTAHPGMISTIAECLAKTRGEPLEALFAACRQNTFNMYGV